MNYNQQFNLCLLVDDALHSVGGHSAVSFSVDRVVINRSVSLTIRIYLTLRFSKTMPMCCSEPGCYIPFLGTSRAEVPGAITEALDCKFDPSVSIIAHLLFEKGYSHVEKGEVKDHVLRYEPEEFRHDS